MSSVTGIELGPSSCVLVGVRPSGRGAGVSAVHTIPSDQSPTGAALASAVHAARGRFRFPRTAHVVAWGLETPSVPDAQQARFLLKPLVAAGFRVDAVLTPAEALAKLAASRPSDHAAAVAWTSINVHGAAIAIIRGGEILYSHTLTWRYDPHPATVREQLLQRYLQVAHIAPYVQHGIGIARTRHGVRVQTLVTCGNLPDLRSLTLPLIDELKIEVETLDATDGLLAKGAVAQEQLAESAPAIRLATAAAAALMPRRRLPWYPAAIAAGLFLGLAMLWAALLLRPHPPKPRVDSRVVEQPAVREVTPLPPRDLPAPAGSTGSTGPALHTSSLGSPTQPTLSDPLGVAPPVRRQYLPPVPPLTSVLIDGGRRLAMFGGEIVAVGDRLGPRVVVSIDSNAVVLQEPSGTRITVLLRPGHSDGVKLGPFAGHGRSPSTPTVLAR